jgi:hypothetical protein
MFDIEPVTTRLAARAGDPDHCRCRFPTALTQARP